MSKNSSKAALPTCPAPPEHSRFKPGQSGNPKGRPKKQPPPRGKLNPLEQAFEAAMIEEGRRPVTINEGGKQLTIPASQAVMRATYVAAIKGSAHAQRTVLSMLSEIERRTHKAHAELFGQAIERKLVLEEERRAWVAAGRREEDLAVHPSDIEIDTQTLDVRIYTPATMEELNARPNVIAFRDDLLKTIAIGELALAELHDDDVLSVSLEQSREMVAGINDRLPPRFRRDNYLPLPASCLEEAGPSAAEGQERASLDEFSSDSGSPEDSDCPS